MEFASLQWRDAPMGTRDQVQLIHESAFVDEVADIDPKHGYVRLDGGDTVMSPGSWEAVMHCVGAACAGVDAVMGTETRNAFCATASTVIPGDVVGVPHTYRTAHRTQL